MSTDFTAPQNPFDAPVQKKGVKREDALAYHESGAPREDRGRPHQALLHRARPLAGLHTRGGRALPGHREGAGALLPVHGPRQPGGGHLQRHGGAGPGGHRPPGRQAGHGGQGRPLQAVRRHRRLRHRGGREGRRPLLPGRQGPGADLRRHQPRGHQGPRVLRDREPAQEGDAHPGLPRRPARHRHHLRRRAAQRAGAGRQEDRGREGGGLRRRRLGHRLHPLLRQPGRAPRERGHVRHQGRDLPRAQGGHERVEGRVRRATPRRAPWPRPWWARTCSWAARPRAW